MSADPATEQVSQARLQLPVTPVPSIDTFFPSCQIVSKRHHDLGPALCSPMVSSTSAFLLGVVEKQRPAAATCRPERHEERPRACRNIVSYPHLRRRERGVWQVGRGREVAAVKALFERELTSSSFGFQLPELGGRFGIKSGASAHYNATLLIRPRLELALS